jgi:uncharacterized membrane protein
MSQIYIVVAIVILAGVALIVVLTRRRRPESRPSALAGIAFLFVLAGLFFSANRLVGYGFMAVGILLAVIDMFRKMRPSD